MSNLSLRELATVIDASLSLGDLPPLDGDQQAVYDIHFDLSNLSPGDLYWDLSRSRESSFGKPEFAFIKGAGGVLTEHQYSEPWAGRYTLRVDNCQLALRHLAYFLRQRARQQALLLFPAMAGPHWLAAIQTLLDIPSTIEPVPHAASFGTATHIGTSSHLRIHALANLQEPSLHATLLLATPDLIILGRPDADWFERQSRPALHRILESLPPAGAILFSDLSTNPPTTDLSAGPKPTWMKFFTATGIRCLRIGGDHHADFQVCSPTPVEKSYRLKIGQQWLRLSDRCYEQAVAEATALVAAFLLGHDQASLSRRLGASDEDWPSSPTRLRPRNAA